MRIAVVGYGYWAKNLVRNFNQLGALYMVCDATAHGRAVAQELAPAVHIVAEWEQVLVADVDGMVIATPAETHAEVSGKPST